MNSSMIDVQTPDGVADCYLTRPDDDAPHPGVLMMIDAIGLRPRTKEIADRIAAEGYVVLVPNLFYRAGRAPIWETPNLKDPESRAEFIKSIGPLMGALTPEVMASDGGAYLNKLAEFTDGPIAVDGYCMGGRQAWAVAATYPDRVAAMSGFHTGGMVTDGENSPHLRASSVTAEVYWGHADNDQSMSPEMIAALDKAMDDAGVKHTTELYEGAAHGYTMSDMGVYDEAAAERHFDALFALLNRTIGAAAD